MSTMGRGVAGKRGMGKGAGSHKTPFAATAVIPKTSRASAGALGGSKGHMTPSTKPYTKNKTPLRRPT